MRCRSLLVTLAGLAALACGSLGSPSRPEPESTPTSSASGSPVAPANGIGAPAQPSPSPSPNASPTPSASPSPTSTPSGPQEGATACGDPLPPPISALNVKLHLKGPDAWTLDSTPIVGPDLAYCAAIGFTDGRSNCPVRPEGSPQRAACELYAVGRAKDTNRPGPTWDHDSRFCTGPASGCANSPDNQFQLLIYVGGDFEACARNGVCGSVTVDR